MSVDVANESGEEADERRIADLARFVLDALHVHPMAELSVLLIDQRAMELLHERWMGEPGPTDVLAFSMDELPTGRGDDDDEDPPPVLLGDVVLCPAVARKQAAQAGHSVGDEMDVLATHGILHLLGYDHAEPDEERAMFALQADLVSRWHSTPGRPAAPAERPGTVS